MQNQYDAIYEEIASEIEAGKTEKGLWTRLFAECNGDEQQTKVLYIKQRAEKLISVERARLEQEASEHAAEAERAEAARLEQLRGTADARLVAAIKDGNWSMASKLLREGVKPDGLEEMGHSLTELARKRNDRQMIQLLESYDDIQVASTSQATNETHEIGAESSDGFFGKLARGDYGLAKTYWLFGVLVGVIVTILCSIIKSPGMIAIAFLAYTAYEIPVIMGIWRSATKYTGTKAWAVLAKVACVLGPLMLVAGLFAIVGLMKNA